jgi:hypothetical protein
MTKFCGLIESTWGRPEVPCRMARVYGPGNYVLFRDKGSGNVSLRPIDGPVVDSALTRIGSEQLTRLFIKFDIGDVKVQSSLWRQG